LGLVTEYPFGLIILCFLLGAGYSYWLYYHDVKRGIRSMAVIGMLVFRFITVTIISFLLLSPLIRLSEKFVEKPIIILGIDNSNSVVKSGDSGFYRSAFPAKLNQLVKDLSEKGEVKVYSFGDQLISGFNPTFSDKKTDISNFFNEIYIRYANRNVAAIAIASDGIYNQGSDPYYAARKIQVPIYTIAMGDTNLKKDLILKKVIANRIAYKNDRIPVEVMVELNKCNGLKSRLVLSRGDIEIDSKEIRSTSDQSVQRIAFWIDARQTGITRYKLQLLPVEGESNFENNRSEFLIEVLDARQKIALLYNAPHPDVKAIRSSLEGSTHFEIELISLEQSVKSFDQYDLVILHQIPSISNLKDLSLVMKAKTSLFFILGSQTDINAFNGLKTGLIINSSKNSFYESEPVVNKEFSMFSLNKQDQLIMDEFPPLLSPFGTYQLSPLADVFMFQQIANVATRTPLIMFSRAGERKIGIIAGENIWRWRISNYIQQSNHEAFDLMMEKIAMFLATKEDKSFFRIHYKNRFSENEPVEMEAEVFNPSYERVTEPDVNITITDSENKNYPFVFSRESTSYYLKAGHFPVGAYKFAATARVGNNPYKKSGEFFVSEINIESAALVADHQLLSRIALAHDGEMVQARDVSEISQKILARQDISSISSYQIKISDLISTPWLFITILLLLSAEWVLRKREGK
jgi:hypothetical protein